MSYRKHAWVGVALTQAARLAPVSAEPLLSAAGREYGVIDVIASEADLIDLQHWLDTTFNLKRQLIPVLIVGCLLGGLNVVVTTIVNMDVTFTLIVGAFLSALQIATTFPFVIATLALLRRLNTYHFQLYTADPSRSEMIEQLARLIGAIGLWIGVIGAVITILYYVAGFLTFRLIIFLIAFMWVLLITLFSAGHHALAGIIGTAKRRTLNAVQARINDLVVEGDIAEKERIETISRLMDYHDRINTTRNSALGIGVILQFLQSLLLPLLASLLGSLNNLLHLFSP